MTIPVGPIISGFAWWLLSRATNPAQLDNIIANIPLGRSNLITLAKLFFGVGVTRYLSSEFSLYALNNYRRADTGRWDWPKEVAVVTGGCSGIGEEIVRALAAKGVKVAVLDVTPLPDRLKNVVSLYVKCDVTDAEAAHNAAEEVRAKLGSASILVNNAGIGSDSPIFDMPPAKVKKLIDVNLTAHWYTCHEFCPDMVKNNKGHIVEIASMSSFVSVGIFSDYSASKAALVSFTESLREQLRTWYRAPDVHVTIVHPHFVSTPLVEHKREAIEKATGKMLTPEHVGGEIAKQIFRCKGAQLVLPGYLSFLRTTRAWPIWLLDGLKTAGGMARGKREKREKVQ